jgi:lysophospholipase L1-like esterase
MQRAHWQLSLTSTRRAQASKARCRRATASLGSAAVGFAFAGALALGCSSSDEPSASVNTGGAAPAMQSTNAEMPAGALPSTPTASTPSGSAASGASSANGGEKPPGSVGLVGNMPAAPAGGGSGGASGPTEPPSAPPDAGAPATPPAQPNPPGFNPCPTDGSPCKIMPLGDSITFGVGSSTGGGYRIELLREAAAAGQKITFVGTQQSGPTMVDTLTFPRANEGHSGFTITQIANLTDNAIRQTSPNIVLLLAGTNDFDGLGQEPTGQAPTRLAALMDRIFTDAPNALLAVAQIIPITMGNGTALVPPYNAALPALVNARSSQGKHVILVDMFTPFNSTPNFASTIMNDFLHPNDAGYVIMGRTWHGAIDSFLPKTP